MKRSAIVGLGISIQAFSTIPRTSFQPQHSEHCRFSSITLSISNFFHLPSKPNVATFLVFIVRLMWHIKELHYY